MHAWVYDPHSGGVKIPAAVKQRSEQRIRSFDNGSFHETPEEAFESSAVYLQD